jgi:hypothetical protein
LTFETELGPGTTFVIRLPMVDINGEEDLVMGVAA